MPRDPSAADVAAIPLRRRVAYATLLSGLSLALGFAIVEGFAIRREAALEALVPDAPELELMRENPAGTGSYRLKPGLDLMTRVKGLQVRIRTNAFGMHWREVEAAKRPRTRRVAFLGDSFAFGCWARDVEHSMVGVFAAGLNRDRVETLNFGVGGYGLDDMELLLREQVAGFGPDWVVVLLFTGNDLRDTWLGLHKQRIEDGTAVMRRDVLEERVPEGLLRQPFLTSPAAPDPSRLRAGLKTFASFRLLFPALGLDNPWVDFAVCRRFTSFSFWSQVPPHEIALQARDVSLRTLERMRDFSRERGARLAVVTIPSREQVYAVRETGRDYDVRLPQDWVRVWARERAVPFLDLWEPLREHALATGEDVYVPGDIHFDERGHALAGAWIREWFGREVR
jgi:lysophospholipase L1-like esterase